MIPIAAFLALVPVLPQLQGAPADWHSLHFLEGAWEAKTVHGPPGVTASGTYIFRKELGGHVLARHTSAQGCKGPADFDCNHGDLLYIYEEPAGRPLKAIYFDNEGHVIHYDVTTPAANTAVLVSEPDAGPGFRLVYELKAEVLSGKFQMRMPGQTEWTSYLEWRGGSAPPSLAGGQMGTRHVGVQLDSKAGFVLNDQIAVLPNGSIVHD